MIPQASLSQPPGPWYFIGMDTLELTDYQPNVEIKVLLVMDMGTHLVEGDEMIRYTFRGKVPETAAVALSTLLRVWFVDKPKPKYWICDSGKSFDSREFLEQAADCNIGQQVTPGQAPWAHGKPERMVQRVKHIFICCKKASPTSTPSSPFIYLWAP